MGAGGEFGEKTTNLGRRERWSLGSAAAAEKEQLGGDEKVRSPVDWVEDEGGNLERVNRSSSHLERERECVFVEFFRFAFVRVTSVAGGSGRVVRYILVPARQSRRRYSVVLYIGAPDGT
jgi:hypothetical protein